MPRNPKITRICCECHRLPPLDLLTYDEVADLLRVHPRTVRNMADDGRLERVAISHQIMRVTRASVEILIDAGRMAADEGIEL